MSQYFFFSGKGGVGKTTIACATAVYYANQGQRTLIVTTDPASNLADVFEQKIGHHITPIEGFETLYAMEIEPDAATQEYREKIIAPFRELMPEDIIASLEEQFNSPCTTEIASFDRFVDFMQNEEYDIVIFDTAPTGHTIRLLELPVDWSKHIEEAAQGGGQTCIGPVQVIQDSKEKYDKAINLLRDTDKTVFTFVMRPEELSLYETERAAKELATIGVKPGEIIVNGLLPESVCDIDFFRKRFTVQQQVLKKVDQAFATAKKYIQLKNCEVKGVSALKRVAEELYGQPMLENPESACVDTESTVQLEAPDYKTLFAMTPDKRLFFFTGKGGVGKTTVSCIMAVHLADKGIKTLLVTTDPAAHLGEVLDQQVGSEPTSITNTLDAVMIDQEEASRHYKARILAEAASKYSQDMLIAMEEELNSPCTQEMAAFDRFTEFIQSEAYQAIVFDTAPTGHTLRLLELPFDYAKQVQMMVALSNDSKASKQSVQNKYQAITSILKDRQQTVFGLVLYPESTPIVESYRAMVDLKTAGIETQWVVANMVLTEDVCKNDFFRSRRRMQQKYLGQLNDQFKLPVQILPLMGSDIKGMESLRQAALLLFGE